MADSPSPMRYALLEPLHLVLVPIALLSLLVVKNEAVFLSVYGVLEAFYLFGFANSAAYRRRVRLKAALDKSAAMDEAMALEAATLRKDDRKRYQAIEKLHRETVQILEKNAGNASMPVSFQRSDLDALKRASLDFCLSMQSFRKLLEDNPPESIKGQLMQASSASDADRQRRELLESRYKHLSSLQTQMSTMDGQLQVVEQTLQYLKEQLGVMGLPGASSAPDVGALVRQVEATRATVQELSAFQVEARLQGVR